MSTKQLASALCMIAEPMSRIAKDEEINGVLTEFSERMRSGEKMNVAQKSGELLAVVPLLLDKHYGDMITIISAMTGKTRAEVEAQRGFEMIDEMMKSIDAEFLRFFKSSAAMAQTATALTK